MKQCPITAPPSAIIGDRECCMLPPEYGAHHGPISPSTINVSFAPRTAPLSEMHSSSDVAFTSRDRVVRLRSSNLRMSEMRTRSLADYLKRSDEIQRERLAYQRAEFARSRESNMKPTQGNIDRHDWDARASEALGNAKKLPPGSKRIEAIKKAAQLRVAADMKDLLMAKEPTE
jgi:hypothetical protein